MLELPVDYLLRLLLLLVKLVQTAITVLLVPNPLGNSLVLTALMLIQCLILML